MKKLAILMVWFAFSAQSVFASQTSQERFAQSVNLLTTENSAVFSKRLLEAAEKADKSGNSDLAVKMRQAAHPDSLAMARNYFKADLEKSDVNGLYAMARDGVICWSNYGTISESFVCLVEIVLTIVTLGEENSTASSSL